VGLLPGYGAAADLVRVTPGEEPRPREAARYAGRYGLFCDTYRALAPIYERIAAGEETG
jgi:hypothetical protein